MAMRLRLLIAAALAAPMALAGWLPRAAFAQEGAAPAPGGGVSGFGTWDWFGLGLRLGLVLLVIWAAVVAMRWYTRRVNGGGAGGGAGRQLAVLETRALGPNRALHLVRLGSRAVLIGVTPERINRLIEIDDPEEVERLSIAVAEADAAPRSLRSVVGGLGDRLARLRATRATGAGGLPAVPAAAAEQLRAEDGHRRDRIIEIQRAIERVRQETPR